MTRSSAGTYGNGSSTVRRSLGTSEHNDGLFVPVRIGGVEINCLIDTGATMSVLHKKKYDSIPPWRRPQLQTTQGQLEMGDGRHIQPLGAIDCNLWVNRTLTMTQRLIVVEELSVPCILGFDFLSKNGAQLNIDQRTMQIQATTIQCDLESRLPSLFRVSLTETLSIPAYTEMIIPGQIMSTVECDTAIIETSMLKADGILLARTLIDPRRKIIPLRVVNMTGETKVLHKSTTLAQGEPAEQQDLERRTGENYASEDLAEHMQELYDKSCVNLSPSEAAQFKTLLLDYQHSFSASKQDIGRTSNVTHSINTGQSAPIKQPLRRTPLSRRTIIQEEVDKMLKQEVIESSASPWASPVVLVKKKDGSYRFCIDYRKLNDVTIKDSYPLPRIDDTLDALQGNSSTRYFSTLDLASGYWQVAMNPADAPKTAFTTPEGLFQFKTMPFGLCNAPATFERLMESVLAGLHWKTCLVYLDDIIVFSSSFQEHLQRLREVFQRLQDAGLKISPKKCTFLCQSVKFLGHIVTAHGIATDPEKTEAIQNWPQPTNLTQVKSFLGTCSYYRRFIPNFADLAKPLHKLTMKNERFIWSDNCTKAFQQLKRHLSSTPVLAYPCATGQFLLDCDASQDSAGAVLSQLQAGEERVIAYYSHAFSKQERNYCTTRRELLAVILAVKQFHHYLYGTKFIVRTDHGSLTWLHRFKNPEGQLARWLELLSSYDFSIEFRPGRHHLNADGLSRIPCVECRSCQSNEVRYLPSEVGPIRAVQTRSQRQKEKTTQEKEKATQEIVNSAVLPGNGVPPTAEVGRDKTNIVRNPRQGPLEISEIRQAQLEDDEVGVLLAALELSTVKPDRSQLSGKSNKCLRYWNDWDRLTVKDGVLHRKWYPDVGPVRYQLIVPHKLRAEILHGLHEQVGHLGVRRTSGRLRQKYYWVGYQQDVSDWCRSCPQCQARRRPRPFPRAPLQPSATGDRFQRVAMDILGPLPESHSGNKYILVISDYFTKWVEAVALPNIEASTVARAFYREFVSRYGVPIYLHTDQGTQFESLLFQELCHLLQINKTRTTAYWPQSDGMVERLNQTLEAMLSKMVSANQRDWDEHLPTAMMAYRSSEHAATGFAPTQMLFGTDIALPIHLVLGPVPGEAHSNLGQFSWDLREQMFNIHQIAREHLAKARAGMREQYDHNLRVNAYGVGDQVWVHQARRHKGLSPKLQPRWEGPFRVVAKLSPLLYRVKRPHSKSSVIHHNRLQPYIPRGSL